MSLQPIYGQSAAADSITVDNWLKWSTVKMDRNEFDSSETYIKKALTLAKTSHQTAQTIKSMQAYANFLYTRLRYPEALRISEEQLALGQQLKNDQVIANAYNNMAVQYRCLGNLQLAADNMLKAIKIAEYKKDSASLRRNYNNLASIFVDLNDKKNSLYYAEKSTQIAALLKDSLQWAKSIVNLANSEVINGQYNRAAQHLQQVTHISEKLNDRSLLLHAFVNLGDINNKTQNNREALRYYQKAADILKADPDPDFEMYTNYGLATSYDGLNDPRTAQKYYDLVLPTAEALMPKNDLKEVYLLGAAIQEKLKHPDIALQLWKKYNTLNDTILNETTQRAIHEAEIKYQSSQKEKAIVEQQLQLSNKNVQLQNKNRVILIAIILIIGLISICLIIYLIYRNKNQLIELNLLKAQIHPHFLFNTLNNLYALSLSKSDKSPEVVLELSQILRYILYECNTSTVNLEKEIRMIERYISLEKIRYQNQLEINMDMDGHLAQFNVAPLLILPLVENAFKHGISKLMEDGWINISAKARQDQFIFKISNNKLPDSDHHAQSSAFGNIGLLNIRKRLDILYPGQHELKIINEEEVFAVIMKLKLKPDPGYATPAQTGC
ncbi:tetratricopeptide repeat protein [Chitinophaga polysaccharea]|uniref:Tetratricopeptide repeat protein n=1 Tax=Chitinophaga polysaccharea TaxID=1293035 RepID=A0A561Q462_9BACT|nr:histidine kinase [Chitinophaga polysaccharea]TWF45135.1 tetratricopeptide repeat protein [Chitinophaga polysaccharea]